uniref:Uncharacterized protein n=1 Tax=Solanum lycopersicum TaxID=4081 RepID=A0A3Q7HKE3_SOLLC
MLLMLSVNIVAYFGFSSLSLAAEMPRPSPYFHVQFFSAKSGIFFTLYTALRMFQSAKTQYTNT